MWKHKQNKYRNVRAVDPVSGRRFQSKAELVRYQELKLEEFCGDITELELQPRFPIVINGVKCFTYVADFKYKRSGVLVVEDVKGFLTAVYRLKKKLFEALYAPLKITEIRNMKTKKIGRW